MTPAPERPPRRSALRGLAVHLLLGVERAPLWLRVAAPLLWAGAIWWLSSRPPGSRTTPNPLMDYLFNLGHAVLFGTLAGLVDLASRGARPWWAVGLAAGYGIVDELHQSLVPGRSPDPFDLVTDFAGALFVVSVARWVRGGERRGLTLAACGLVLAFAGAALATFGPSLLR